MSDTSRRNRSSADRYRSPCSMVCAVEAPGLHDSVDLLGHRGWRGFTLLELLVVLLLLSLLAAFAAPNLARFYASIERQTERDYILNQFAGLGRMALRDGRSYVVESDGPTSRESGRRVEPSAPQQPDADAEPYVIDLPEGWTIDLSHPLVIRVNGVCLGTQLTLLFDGTVETRLALQPPYCRLAPHA